MAECCKRPICTCPPPTSRSGRQRTLVTSRWSSSASKCWMDTFERRRSGRWSMMTTWMLVLLCTTHLSTMVSASGFFELEIVDLKNPRGRLASGQCCSAPASSREPCGRECSTYFRLCLKEYQSNVTVTSPCTYGNSSSPVLGGNSFTFVEPHRARARLVVPFSFRWTRSFTLVLEAMDSSDASQPPGKHREIERAYYSGILDPSTDWHSLTFEGSNAQITYRVRVQCDPRYYSATCTKFCRPYNDTFGHYTCDQEGEKVCDPGWNGTNCEVPICKAGCHPQNGLGCDRPGECSCRPGWTGENCDQCLVHPGCKHGYCNKAWDCICETNWGGMLCDQDLDYCGTHEPCQNGGTCENPAPDAYLCKCPEGFSGVNCEAVANPCATGPCHNGATCHTLPDSGGFNCTCPPGWTGPTCQINVDECQSSPCLNGATCVDLVNGFQCRCADGWQGQHCDQDVDECQQNPCRNAVDCRNGPGNYTCRCLNGWIGRNCEINVNDCRGQCSNGATCIDLVDDYHCACSPGFKGRHCEVNVNECDSNPCRNGGECVDLINGFKCICPLGYTGHQCQTDTDLCHPNPCSNGAPCFNTPGDYYCLCTADWEGKNCTRLRKACNKPPCLRADSCLMSASGGRGTCVHGRCVTQPDGASRCLCDPGYTGQLCNEREMAACDSNPCLNGATCVNTGVQSFTCVCRDGYEGSQCQQSTNHCAGQPCANGGTCINGLDAFHCACPPGFSGADCRDRIGHCALSPCAEGSTCVEDAANGFLCLCPAGRSGSRCEFPSAGKSCLWAGRVYPNDSSWDDDCNRCVCRRGRTICTRVWCGPKNCLAEGGSCASGEICVPTTGESCLTPPCATWGVCRPLGRHVGPSLVPGAATCWPNLARLSPTCARLTLVLDPDRTPAGFSASGLCTHLRKLAAAQSSLWDSFGSATQTPPLVVLCELKENANDVVEVTVSMAESAESSRAGAAARVLGDLLTAHHKEGSSWATLIEVKVETALLGEELPPPLPGRGNYVVAVICAIAAGLLILAAVVLLFMWFIKKHGFRADGTGLNGRRCVSDTAVLEKSNNLQNEENLRRQLSQMKTLNVMELTRCNDHHPSMQVHPVDGCNGKLSEPQEMCDSASDSSSSGLLRRPEECSYASGECSKALESNPIYKAPMDVRNNMISCNVAAKEVNVKVLQPTMQRSSQRMSLHLNSDVAKCKEVVV